MLQVNIQSIQIYHIILYNITNNATLSQGYTLGIVQYTAINSIVILFVIAVSEFNNIIDSVFVPSGIPPPGPIGAGDGKIWKRAGEARQVVLTEKAKN